MCYETLEVPMLSASRGVLIKFETLDVLIKNCLGKIGWYKQLYKPIKLYITNQEESWNNGWSRYNEINYQEKSWYN
jgi:hypothetical protein